MNKPAWEMTVPVLSTSHVPGSDALDDLVFDHEFTDSVLDYGAGWFVFLPATRRSKDTDDRVPGWLHPVLQWFDNHYPDEFWIRFDRDGCVVDGLPTYDW